MGKRGYKLSLRSAFQTKTERASRFKNLLDDLMELIHLDRIHTDIGISVAGLFNGLTECGIELGNSRAKKILKTDEQRKLNPLLPQVLNDLIHIDTYRITQYRPYREMAFFVDAEIGFTPQRDPVQIFRIFDRPDIFFG